MFLSGSAPLDLDKNIIKTGVFVFMTCWNYDVSFVSEMSVKLSVGLLWTLQLLFIQTELPSLGTVCPRKSECRGTRIAPEIPYLAKNNGGRF